MANIKRSALDELLRDDDTFQLAIGAAVKVAYGALTDAVTDYVEFTQPDYAVLADVVTSQVRDVFCGDVTSLRIAVDRGEQGRVDAIHVRCDPNG